MPYDLDMSPSSAPVTERIERLNRASAKRVIDPDVELPGAVGDGQVLPDELLSIHGLDLDLTPEQRRTLGREEVASIFDNGIRFEAVLEAGFALQVYRTHDLTDPRVTFLLHEMGEETRHQRLFQRLIGQLEPQAVNPFVGSWFLARLDRLGGACIQSDAPQYRVLDDHLDVGSRDRDSRGQAHHQAKHRPRAAGSILTPRWGYLPRHATT